MAEVKPKRKSRKPPKMYSAAEAADIVHLAPSTVRGYCNRGEVGTKKTTPIGLDYYLLDDADIEWLKNEANRPKGRPPKDE